MSGMITGVSHQIAVRIRKDIHELLKRDAGNFRGVSTVVSFILERYYEDELKKIRTKKNK